MSKILAKKVSVSLPEDIINFIDERGSNRSKTLVTIIEEYKSQKENEELNQAYKDYFETYECENEDLDDICALDIQGVIE